MDDVVNCVNAVARLMDKSNLDTHSIQQLIIGMGQTLRQGMDVQFERATGQLEVLSRTGGGIDVNRIVDVVATGVGTIIHTEIKTGYASIGRALNIDQMIQDAALAIDNAMQRSTDSTVAVLRNVTQLRDLEFGTGVPPGIQNRMREIVDEVVAQGFDLDQLRAAIGSFEFVDKCGQVIRAELNEHGETIFTDAMGVLLGTDGTMAQVALSAATHSPDFTPAMQAVFGPSGAVADAATAAANGSDLAPALDGLENKIEEGVTEAMDEAGDAVAAHGAESLGSRISSGATALGNIFTSIPQMYQQINALGEAWDHPLESTEDYMNLFSAVGGTITQGVQTFEALASITQVASAAQAIFNAVMAMNPIVLIVIAVIVLIGLIVALIVYWDEVCAAVRDNPWIAAIGLIFGPIGILIALIVLIASHWEEVKLAVLQAANFISIQAQRIAAFFVGIYTVAGQVWDIIVATAINAGIGIANAFISVGTQIQNFFIGVINGILEMYNAVAESAIGEFVGLEPAELIPEVDLETRLIPPREVPTLDVDAAFNTDPITGGLEDMIAEQETAVAAARAADEERRAADAAAEAAPAAPGAPAGPGGLPALPGGAPAGLPAAPAALPRPALPEGAAAAPAAAAGGSIDASVTVGSINVSINAERLEADAADLLSEEIIQQLQARLGALRSEQDFRTGVR